MKKYLILFILFSSFLITIFIFISKEDKSLFNYNFISSEYLFTESDLSLNGINLLKENNSRNFYYELSIGDVLYYNTNKVSYIKQIIIEEDFFTIILDNEIITEDDLIHGKVYQNQFVNNLYFNTIKYKYFLLILLVPCFILIIKEFKGMIKEIRFSKIIK